MYFRIEGVIHMENEMITVVDGNGVKFDATLVTYLVSDDYLNKYIVYSKG